MSLVLLFLGEATPIAALRESRGGWDIGAAQESGWDLGAAQQETIQDLPQNGWDIGAAQQLGWDIGAAQQPPALIIALGTGNSIASKESIGGLQLSRQANKLITNVTSIETPTDPFEDDHVLELNITQGAGDSIASLEDVPVDHSLNLNITQEVADSIASAEDVPVDHSFELNITQETGDSIASLEDFGRHAIFLQGTSFPGSDRMQMAVNSAVLQGVTNSGVIDAVSNSAVLGGATNYGRIQLASNEAVLEGLGHGG
jgi:hypothetical protein